MNNDSRRIESSTATAVTSASSRNVGVVGIRYHSACAAKNVEKRIAMADASSAFAVAGYLRAARSSHTTSMPIATMTASATRMGGESHPCWIEYRRKNTAPTSSEMPAMAAAN